MWHKLYHFFIDPYHNASVIIRTRVHLLYISLFIAFPVFVVLQINQLLFAPAHLLHVMGYVIVVIAVMGSLWCIRLRKPTGAVYCLFGLFLGLFFHNVLFDTVRPELLEIERVHTTIVSGLILLMYFSMVAIKRRQVVLATAIGLSTVVVHFVVIIQHSYHGQWVGGSLGLVVIGSVNFALTGFASHFLNKFYIDLLMDHESVLADIKSKYSTLFTNMLDGYAYLKIIRGHNGHILNFERLEMNRMFYILGGLAEQDTAQSAVLLDFPTWINFLTPLCNEDAMENKLHFFCASSNKWLELYAFSPRHDYVICFLRDISSLKEEEIALEGENKVLEMANRELSLLSVTDQLTGLLNRRGFEPFFNTYLTRCQTNGQYLSAVMVDIDFFKRYNDYYGHLQGDDCLRTVADALTKALHRESDKIGRYGGEEFIIVLVDCSPDSIVTILERLKNCIQQAALVHEASPIGDTLSISIGACSLQPGSSDTFSSIVALADQALYQAKQEGRNCYRIYQRS